MHLKKKKIALVAHDNRKSELCDWAQSNKESIVQFELMATGTTGRLLSESLGVPVRRFQSGPLGGDQQIGALIAEGDVDMLIFFWDPLEPLPHDPDIKALLRLAVVWNIPVACNRSTAEYLFSSSLLFSDYKPAQPDFEDYRNRKV